MDCLISSAKKGSVGQGCSDLVPGYFTGGALKHVSGQTTTHRPTFVVLFDPRLPSLKPITHKHCTLEKSFNRNSREQSYIKWQFLKKLMMKT